MKTIIVLLLTAFSISAEAKNTGVLIDAFWGLDASETTFGRMSYTDADPVYSLGLGVFRNIDTHNQVSLKGNVLDLILKDTSLFRMSVDYTHLVDMSTDVKWLLTVGLNVGYRTKLGNRLFFSGPIFKLGFSIGDDKVSMRPFVYTSFEIGEGNEQSRVAAFGAGAGLTVYLGVF